MSLGGRVSSSVCNAVQGAINTGITFVVAAGEQLGQVEGWRRAVLGVVSRGRLGGQSMDRLEGGEQGQIRGGEPAMEWKSERH